MKSRLTWGMGAFGAFLILSFNAMIGYDLLRARAAVLQDAREETRNLSLLLEHHATDSFSGVEKILAGAAEVLAIRAPQGEAAHAEVQALLRRLKALSPITRSILVLSADGRLLHDSNEGRPYDLDLSDRRYFTVHRDGGSKSPDIGHPERDRTSGRWFLAVSRRLDGPDGGFAGVAVAVLDVEIFRSFYRTLRPGHDTLIGLFHTDGIVITRDPDHESHIGRSVLDMPLFSTLLKSGPQGTVEHVPPDSGQTHLFSYRRSAVFPIVVGVSMAREAVLESWRARARNTGLVLLGGDAMMAALLLLLLREVGRREGMLADLQASDLALRQSQTRLIADIAARHSIENELIAAKQASDLANRAKTQFLANMSHELRTPLNAIIGFAEALEAGIFGSMAPRHGEYVSDIRRSGLHLLSLINDVLDTTKIESGKFQLHEEMVSIPAIAAECLRQIEPHARGKRVVLTTRVPDDLPALYADDRAVRQILLNLLSNAVKFTPSGGTTELSAGRSGDGALMLRVSDSGIGIPPEDLERVLEPFHQVDNSHTRRYQGTGLGLPLVKALVELHGGRFVLDSTPGAGTVATAIFPADRLRARAVEAEAMA